MQSRILDCKQSIRQKISNIKSFDVLDNEIEKRVYEEKAKGAFNLLGMYKH